MPFLKNVLGLDLGSHSLKAVELSQGLRSVEVVRFHAELREDDVALAEQVTRMLSIQSFSRDHVVAGLVPRHRAQLCCSDGQHPGHRHQVSRKPAQLGSCRVHVERAARTLDMNGRSPRADHPVPSAGAPSGANTAGRPPVCQKTTSSPDRQRPSAAWPSSPAKPLPVYTRSSTHAPWRAAQRGATHLRSKRSASTRFCCESAAAFSTLRCPWRCRRRPNRSCLPTACRESLCRRRQRAMCRCQIREMFSPTVASGATARFRRNRRQTVPRSQNTRRRFSHLWRASTSPDC